MMKMMKFRLSFLLLTSLCLAQKGALPKDLPPYGPEKPLQVPAVHAAKLDNGLAVLLVSEPGFPKVAFTVAAHGGLAADPADRPGISELLSKTIDQGTRTRNAKQLAQELQNAGGDLSANFDKDSVGISTVVLSSKVDSALGVLADILQNASFPDSEVTLAKRNLTDSLEQEESEPSFLARRAMGKVLFADHPYHVISPTKESIAAATPADLRQVFSQRFRPDRMVLVAVGDFQNEKMMEIIKAKLGAWKASSQPAVTAPPQPTKAPEHAVFLVARPGSIQTTLELGTLGPREDEPDYAATEVANALYGGLFGSRLVTNIREDKGYTYSPYSYVRTFQLTGQIITHADVRNEVTGPSLNEMVYELNRLATTSPTGEELANAKRYLVGTEALRLQGRGSLANQLATLWIDGLAPEQISIYGQKVAATTEADVNAAARKYFPAYRAGIVAVGEEKVVREALAPLGIPVRTLP